MIRFYMIILEVGILLMLYNISMGDKRWCHRELPSKKGQWREEIPYWQTEGCINYPYNQSAAYSCLKGRTIYVIGNSIARQYGFAIYQLLGGETYDRQQQKQSCLKSGLLWESCEQTYSDIKIKHLFLLYMDGFDYKERNGFPYFRYQSIDNDKILYDHSRSGHFVDAIQHINSSDVLGNTPDDYAVGSKGTWKEIEDNCEGWTVRDCLKSFFNGSTENDILIFSIGMMQVVAYNGMMVGFKVDPLDNKSWLTASAVNFKAHLAATFKGHVFRVTMAQANPHMNRHHWTDSLREADNILHQLWTPSSVNSHDQWYTIDQWAINEGRNHLYDDSLHFNGPLSDATVQQVLNELCPNQGSDKTPIDWSKPELNDTIIRVTNPSNDNDNLYYISVFGYRHKVLHNDSSIPWYFQDKNTMNMTVNELNTIYKSKIDIPILYNNLVFRYIKDTQVWLLNKDCKCRQRFHNGAAFMNRGFDFDNVVIFPLVLMDLLPIGDWLY